MAVFTEACRQKDSHVFTTPSSDADGRVSGTVEYDVFGKVVAEAGVFVSSSGGMSALVFGYAGKPYDPVTGLSDYGFRDYAPSLARFTTVDPIRDGSNWYAYCNSDPVNYVDAWGLDANDSQSANGRKILVVNVTGVVTQELDNYLSILEANGTGKPNITVTHADNAAELSDIFNNNVQTDIVLTGTHGVNGEAEIGGSPTIKASDLNVTSVDTGNRLFLDMCHQGQPTTIKSWSESTNIPENDIKGNESYGRSAISQVFLFDVWSGKDIDDAWNDYRKETDNYNDTQTFSNELLERWDEMMRGVNGN